VTAGLTLSQGAADDEIGALKSSDVAHGMTTRTETDTYGFIKKSVAASGGLYIAGLSESNSYALLLAGHATGTDLTKTSSSLAPVQILGYQKSGTTSAACAANSNVVIMQNATTVTWIGDAEGQVRQLVTSTDAAPSLDLTQSSSGDVATRYAVPADNISYTNGIDNSVTGNPLVWSTAASDTAVLGTSDLMQLTSGGKLTVSDPGTAMAASTFMTSGIKVSQGAADNEAMCWASSDVAHGMTSAIDTDTYGRIQKVSATAGGLNIEGYTEDTQGVYISACVTNNNTTKTTSGIGGITLDCYKKSGTTVGANDADSNLVVIKAAGTTRFIFDNEGSAHADVEWITFDNEEDLKLIGAVEATLAKEGDPIKAEYATAVNEKAQILLDRGLITKDAATGKTFLNTTRFSMLQAGAHRQAGKRIAELEATVAALEARLEALEKR
jgi:hypothetical protein